jgi:hypothetical protein
MPNLSRNKTWGRGGGGSSTIQFILTIAIILALLASLDSKGNTVKFGVFSHFQRD